MFLVTAPITHSVSAVWRLNRSGRIATATHTAKQYIFACHPSTRSRRHSIAHTVPPAEGIIKYFVHKINLSEIVTHQFINRINVNGRFVICPKRARTGPQVARTHRRWQQIVTVCCVYKSRERWRWAIRNRSSVWRAALLDDFPTDMSPHRSMKGVVRQAVSRQRERTKRERDRERERERERDARKTVPGNCTVSLKCFLL